MRIGHVGVEADGGHAGVDARVLQLGVLDDEGVAVALRLVHVSWLGSAPVLQSAAFS